jgi:hypothetical protein
MADETGTLGAFLRKYGISSTAERALSNPSMDDPTWEADHWSVTLRRAKRGDLPAARMTVSFSMGIGHGGKHPSTDDVLDSIASDAAGFENAQSFEDWAADYGFDTDSRKAERIFRAVEREAKRLRAFLGDALYDELLWRTERQ